MARMIANFRYASSAFIVPRKRSSRARTVWRVGVARSGTDPSSRWSQRVGDQLRVVVAAAADGADLGVLLQHELAAAGVGLGVEDMQHVVVVFHPPPVAATHVVDDEVVPVVRRAVVLLIRNHRADGGSLPPVVEDVRVVLVAGVATAEEAVLAVALGHGEGLVAGVVGWAAGDPQ